MENETYKILKIYASSTDKVNGILFFEHIVRQAKKQNISGVTVYRGIMGYGMSSKDINTSKFWELTEKLPVVIEIVDSKKNIDEFYKIIEPDILEMPKGCMVYEETINLKLLKKGQ